MRAACKGAPRVETWWARENGRERKDDRTSNTRALSRCTKPEKRQYSRKTMADRCEGADWKRMFQSVRNLGAFLAGGRTGISARHAT
jgi:hypothetical protein